MESNQQTKKCLDPAQEEEEAWKNLGLQCSCPHDHGDDKHHHGHDHHDHDHHEESGAAPHSHERYTGEHGHKNPDEMNAEELQQWIDKLEAPDRETYQCSAFVLPALFLFGDTSAMTVAEVGAGTGWWSRRMAAYRTPPKAVIAVDPSQAMVSYLQKRIEDEHIANMTANQCTPVDWCLPEPVDLCLLSNVYHHMESTERVRIINENKKYLKEGGRIAIVEFTKESPIGPPESMRLEPAVVKQELTQAGFTLLNKINFRCIYVLTFKLGA